MSDLTEPTTGTAVPDPATADRDRMERRRAALLAALTALGDGAADPAHVAAVATAPGFRVAGSQEGPLAEHRADRRRAMTQVLARLDPAEVADTARLVERLTVARPDLVHPMTGETMTVLDWVNRGGDPAAVRL